MNVACMEVLEVSESYAYKLMKRLNKGSRTGDARQSKS